VTRRRRARRAIRIATAVLVSVGGLALVDVDSSGILEDGSFKISGCIRGALCEQGVK
jgi:hypothetical protein